MMLLETAQYGNPAINIGVFALFVVATMAIVIIVTRQKSKATDFYTGGAAFSGRQNGLAITGDYLSAAAFLGVTGAIALYGYDGLLYSVGFFVAWIVALFLVAEPLRNTGKYTMADVLSFRMNQKPVRTAAATSTLVISFVYLLAQMAGAGGLVALLLGVSDKSMQSLVIVLVGALMVVDEVQTGLGRTGQWFGLQHAGVVPDVVTLAKGLGNGFPIGACLARGPAAALFSPGGHGSTFGGNPLACRVGCAVIDVMAREQLPQRAAVLGRRLLAALRAALHGHPDVLAIRGLGLMIGIELDRPCAGLVGRGLEEERLLITVTRGSTLRLLPPLICSEAQIDDIAARVARLLDTNET